MTGENNGLYMPVAPAYGGGYGNDGFFGGNSAWFILILLAMFGWGGNGFGGNNGGAAAASLGAQATANSNTESINDRFKRCDINGKHEQKVLVIHAHHQGAVWFMELDEFSESSWSIYNSNCSV